MRSNILFGHGVFNGTSLSEKWIESIETLPRVEGYVVTGIFELGKNLYAQHCDSKGNQQWLRYKEETHSWKIGKYVTGGCAGWND